MNKRQLKKYRNKVIYPLIDEMNLLTLNQDELKEAIEGFERYCMRHYHYKHYKDREKLMNKRCYYCYPVGERTREFMRMATSLTSNTIIVSDSKISCQDMQKYIDISDISMSDRIS